MRKRKAKSTTNLEITPSKKKMTAMEIPGKDLISPTSKILLFKLDVFACNGRPLSNVELGAADLESIWTNSLLRDLGELSGYTSSKTKNNAEIRIQYQLKWPMSIRKIAFEAEFNHERTGPQGVEILRCRVVGLGNIRKVDLGERIRLTVVNANFDITPTQIIEWIARFGTVHEGHR
jgi:hypothetical protein